MTSATIAPRTSRLIALWALACLLAGCVNPNYIGVQDTGTVSGRVVDAVTLKPIANAIVSVNSITNKHTLADGTFSLEGAPIGTQTVTVYQNGYQTSTTQVVVSKGQTSDAGVISLQPTPQQ